jgi:sodium-dependent dicarboxylate transporter 2/3/5
VLTPIGTPPNIIMLGFLDELAPQAPTVSFFQWMIWGVVAMALYFLVAYVVLWRMFPSDVSHIQGAREFIRSRVEELGGWTRAQKNTMIAFGVAVVLWVAPSVLSLIHGPHSEIMKAYDSHCPESIAAMVGGLLLFFLPVDLKKGQMTLDWKEGVEGIEWGTLLLFGGGLAMGSLMYTTGLSDWIGGGIKEMMGGQPSEILFVGVFCVTCLLLAEFTSHTAAINLIGSIAIGTAVSLGFNPIPVAVGVALASSLGFMMPVSTPPNAIVYASGMVPITKMIRSGIIIDIIGVLLIRPHRSPACQGSDGSMIQISLGNRPGLFVLLFRGIQIGSLTFIYWSTLLQEGIDALLIVCTLVNACAIGVDALKTL